MRFLVILLFVLSTGVTPLSWGNVGRDNQCDDLASYFDDVDDYIAQGMVDVASDPKLADELERSLRKAEATEMSILALSPEEMEPVITLVSVPGNALLDMDSDDIPTVAQELHASAMEQWIMFPALLRTVSTGGIFGAMVFTEDMDRATRENYDAQLDVLAACPDEVEEWKDQSEAAGANFNDMEFDTPRDLGDMDPEDLVGIGYTILFFADESDISDDNP